MSRHFHNSPRHRPGQRHMRWLYGLGLLLLLSGAGWLVAHYLLRPATGLFAELPHPAEPWWLRLHGAAAFGFMIAFGALLPHHVGHNWRRRQHYRSGMTVVTTVGVLCLTGYGLYYLVSDTLHPLMSIIHWTVGLFATGALVAHVGLSYRAAQTRTQHLPRTEQVRPREKVTSS